MNLLFQHRVDAHVKSQKAPVIVIPANAGIQENQRLMDSRVRGSDSLGDFLRVYQSLESKYQQLRFALNFEPLSPEPLDL